MGASVYSISVKCSQLAGNCYLMYMHGWRYWDVPGLNGLMAVWVGNSGLWCGDGFLFVWGFLWVQ